MGEEEVRLEHGSGGALSRQLIEEFIHPVFRGEAYPVLTDASPIEPGSELFLTTDGFVVDPPFFPGGDIGRLCIIGTCNDLAVCGAEPVSLSLALTIEEGFSISALRRILRSTADASREAGARVVTGDTKVVPRGKGGGIFATTAGVGRKAFPHPLLPSRIRDGDSVLVSGPLGAHGLAILAARESLPIGESLRSDAAFLLPLARALFPLGEALRFMRDATRGGASAVLNEAVNGSPIGIEVEESLFPVTEEIRTVSDLLGLNPLEIANEGVLVAFVDRGSEEPALERLRSHSLGKEAMCVGRVTTSTPGAVVLTTRIGGKRILDFPRGLLLPRIC